MQNLTRREALYAIGAGVFAAARPSAQDASFEFDAIDHVEFYVSQVERSRDFFAAVFGTTLLKNASASKSYVKIGSAYLAFERPRRRTAHHRPCIGRDPKHRDGAGPRLAGLARYRVPRLPQRP